MKMPDDNANEAGPAATESSFGSVTKPRGDVTSICYAKNGNEGKQNALTVETPVGRIAINARQPKRALAALIRAGTKGVTALELSSWAYRLGAYVHTLRHDYGLTIETLREPHDGGWHGRYVLRTPCQIIGGEA